MKIHPSRIHGNSQEIHDGWFPAGASFAHHRVVQTFSMQSAVHSGVVAIRQYDGHVTSDVQILTNHGEA